ncbi:MAG: hypothetical protein E7419_02445 [Ruminococcaceae bacterium]|nr:hypothetical protein [Oscillospiraceae bacterium]
MKMKIKLKLLSKILIFALLVSNLYFPMEALAASTETDFPAYSDEIDYGRGVFSAAVTGGAICYDKDGNPLMCFSVQGGMFYVCNLLTGEIVDKESITGKYVMSHLVKTASDGKVYNHHYEANTFDVYDPLTGEYKEVYPGVSIHSQDGGNVTHDGKILLGSYYKTGACAYEYDIKTNTVKTYGPLDKNSHYIKGIDADENYIYAGTGIGKGNTKLYRINRTTGEKSVIYDFGGSIVYNVKVNSNYIIAQTGSGCYIIDKNNYSSVDLLAGSIPSDPSPYDENLFYTIVSGKEIRKIDAENKKSKWMCNISDLDEHEEVEFTQWATLPTGEKVLGFRTNKMNKIGYFNPKTNKVVMHKLENFEVRGPKIQSLEISPDNIIYMGGYQTAMAAYDIEKEEFIYKLQYWDQNEGVGFLNGKTYFGVYTGAQLWKYDPEKEWNYSLYKSDDGNSQGVNANPRMVYDIKESQDRPFVIKEYDNKLYIGTIPAYNILGGSLTIYSENETETPSAVTYKDIIQNQSITGIAVKGNLVYLSSSVTGGLGIDPIETQGKIAVFDTDTGTLVTQPFTPDLPIIGTNSKAIGELSFGPDGLLWGASSNQGLVFALDPETFEVKKYVSVADADQGAFMRPVYLKWGDDGLLYTTAGAHLSVINPETMTYKRLTRNVAIMSLDSNGDIWYAKQGNFYKMEINQFARLKAILDSIDYNDYESSTALGELKLLCDSAKLLTEDSDRKDIIDAIKNINAKKKELNNTSKYVSDFSAELDYLKQTVKISGTLKTGEEVSIRILSPEGKVVLLDQVSKDVKSFTKTYRISPLLKGEYKIYLDAKSYLKPVMRSVNSNPPEDAIVINSVSASDDSGVVTTRLSNYYDNTVTLNVFVAEYYKQSQILKQSKFETYKVNPGSFAIFESQFANTSDTEYKLFIWDENMAPITAPYEN